MALNIDLAAGARPLDAEEFRVWAQDQTVFLSSVMGELAAERRAVAEALEDLGVRVRWFEDFGGRDDSAEDAYLSEVRASTIYLGLLGAKYGSRLPAGQYKGYAATHAEYLEARAHGKRISFWVRSGEDEREGPANTFLDELYLWHVTGNFADPSELSRKVEKRLREMAAEDVAPWVKLGDIIIRATRFRARGTELVVESRVYDRGVLRQLEEASGGSRPFAGSSDLQVTYGDRSGSGRITDFSTEATSGAFTHVTITLTVEWSSGRDMMAFGTQGLTAEDITEASVRAGLLGEPLPRELSGQGFGSMVKAEDPLVELQTLSLPEGAVPALAHLLVVEDLVGSARASSVESFSLGPNNRGERHLQLTWREPAVYSNVAPQSRSVEGTRRWG
jgi:hypothetical protein